MRRNLLPFLVAAAALVPVPALASGDSCDSGWSLDFSAKPRCSNIPALVPGNDTRANLLLLLADRHGGGELQDPVVRPTLDWPEFRDRFDGKRPEPSPDAYASGEGSRCLSNDGGVKAFADAVGAAKGLSTDEAKALTDARSALAPSCAGGDAAKGQPAIPAGTSAQGKAFSDYLRAVAAFYSGRFDEAAPTFARLSANEDPWLSETATYMVARNALNRMQTDAFDEYGTFKGPSSVDKARADETSRALNAYLAKYPKGRYAASAVGLSRRVLWLSGDQKDLAARYAELMARPASARGLSDGALADEFDNKSFADLKPGETTDTTILAVLDLMALRKPNPGEPKPPRPDLASQRELFSAEPDLYRFLEAALAFYGDNDPRTVLLGIPDDARRTGGNHLWFSRQFLRGLALEALKDRNARGFWKELAQSATRSLDRTTVELALALNDERRGDPDDAFAPGSPVSSPAIRSILLTRAAGPDLLRARANDAGAPARERQVALYTLLRKEIVHGDYAGFLSDLPLVPRGAPKDGPVDVDPMGEGAIPLGLFQNGQTAGDIGCPALAQSVSVLAREASSNRAKLCVAEWMRLNDLDPNRLADSPAPGALGSGPSGFKGKVWSRDALYASVITDRSASPDDRAFALYRAVKCYEPSGYNACGAKDAPKADRARWYNALRADYPNSRWAKGLKYWW